MKLLTAQYIRTLNPCSSGIESFERNYPGFKGTLCELLSLENVSYNDKIWLAEKVINIKTLQQWSVECAEHVLDNYESQYPNDSRVRDCIETTKQYLVGEATLKVMKAAHLTARSAVYSTADSTADSATYSAAHLVAHLTADSAYLANSAADSTYSAAHSAAHSVAYSAYSAYSAHSAAHLVAHLTADSAYLARSAANSAANSAAHLVADSTAHLALSAHSAAHLAAHLALSARSEQEDINLSILIALLENE